MALPSSGCQKVAIAGEDPQIMLFGKMIQAPGLANVIEIKEEEESLSPRGFDEVGVSFGMSSSGSDEDEDNQSFVLNQTKQQSITSSENLSRDSENHSRDSHSEIEEKAMKKPEKLVQCPRCNSLDTKFCYFNNYNVNQPRHFCKHCQRYWTAGGTLRNVPIGAGKRKSKHAVRQALSPTCLLYRREERGDAESMATSCTTNMPPPTSLDLFGGTQLDCQNGFTKSNQRHSFPSDVKTGLGEIRSSQPFLQYRQPGFGSQLDLQSELKASQVISNSMFPKSNTVKTLQNDESSASHMTLRTEFSETSEIKSSREVGYTGVNGLMAVSHVGYNGSSNKNESHDLSLCSSPLHERTTEISSVSDSEALSSNDKAFLGRPSQGWCGGRAAPALEGMWPYLYNMYWTEMPQQAVASNTLVTGDMVWPWAPFAATPVLGPQGWRLTCFGAMAPTTSVAAGNHENTTATVTAMLGKRPAQDETEAASSVSKTSRLLDPEASANSSTQSKTSLLSHSSGSTITMVPWK